MGSTMEAPPKHEVGQQHGGSLILGKAEKKTLVYSVYRSMVDEVV